MATTAAGAALTSAHRAQQLAVRARTLQGLMTLWRTVDVTDLAGTIDAFTQAAVLLAGQQHDVSATTAARYFSLFRSAEDIPGKAAAVVARRPAADAMANQIRGSALKGIIDGRKAGMDIVRAKNNGLVRVSGAVTKIVLGGGSMTITGSTERDRKALGWARVTSGDPCAFCRALSARGPVYKTEKSADFESHDHCGCSAEPVYRGAALDLGAVAQSSEHERQYRDAQSWARENGTMSEGTSNNALNNYRRYLAAGAPTAGSAGTGEASGNAT